MRKRTKIANANPFADDPDIICTAVKIPDPFRVTICLQLQTR